MPVEVLEPEVIVPQVGQGVLAVECRAGDTGLVSVLAQVDDPGSHAAVTAERTVLAELQAGCSAPLGAYAAGTGVMHLTAIVVAEDGGTAVRASRSGPPSRAEELGRDVAAELLRLGAGTIVAGPAVTSNGDDV
jgi:hydroxymethylbilane synthase